ncbi:hypothetical protein GOP47_0016236 [Adiantum capillus-veneris]|uniref:Uncharacterized protein n=1 Tax=Adiantum capillus-veneris TaxID=13818 RepID=A0A9D4UID9_ADICA|nr:hypothetical protein GOP47_0016236 [Adiantum capillus-veneris]
MLAGSLRRGLFELLSPGTHPLSNRETPDAVVLLACKGLDILSDCWHRRCEDSSVDTIRSVDLDILFFLINELCGGKR